MKARDPLGFAKTVNTKRLKELTPEELEKVTAILAKINLPDKRKRKETK